MSTFTRYLTFLTSDLGNNASLVLTFDDGNNPDEYKSVFPVVWKVANFGGSGQQAFKVRYRSELGFISGLTAPLGTVYAYTRINPGEKTILTEGGNPPAHSFSTPTPIQPVTEQMVAENDARAKVDIGFGVFERSDRPPAQTLFFEGVDRFSSVQVGHLTPTLLGHVSTSYNYTEGEILKSPIPFPVIFNEKLVELDDDTYWKLELNETTREYRITPAP